MSRSECDQHHDEDDEQDNMKDTSHQLDPRDEPECVHVHQSFHNQQSEDDQCHMPSLCHIVGIVDDSQGLYHVRGRICNAGKQ